MENNYDYEKPIKSHQQNINKKSFSFLNKNKKAAESK